MRQYRIAGSEEFEMTDMNEHSFSFLEKIIFTLILTASLLCFSYGDIEITSLHGFAFLDAVKTGNVLQYYSFSIPYHSVPPVYDICYYLFWGIWELPLWLINQISGLPISAWLRVVWCKILLFLLYYAAVKVTVKMIGHFTSGHEAGEYRLWMLLSPLGLLTVFMMGQYDIIYLVIMLYAFDRFFEKKFYSAALLIGISGLFKYFPMIIAVPAFLLVEKRKWRLFQYFSCMILPVICGKIFFMFDQTPVVGEIRKAFFKHMFGRLMAPEIVLDSGKAALFIILYILICFWAYASNDPEGKVHKEKILYFPFLVLCSLFLCILWHVGWMLLLLPFIVLAAAWNRRFKVEIFYASLLLFGAALVYVSGYEHKIEPWFPHSSLLYFLPKMEALPDEAKYTFISLFSHYELVPKLFFSFIVSGLILLAVFTWPGWKEENPPPEKRLSRWELWLGFGIVTVLVSIFISLHLLSVRAEQKLFQPGSSALKFYRPSWRKEKKSFSERSVVNGIHLKQKQLSPAVCLMPRPPVKLKHNPSADPARYDLFLPSWNGIQAKLNAIHILTESPMKVFPVIRLSDQDGKTIPAELKFRIPNQHIVISFDSDMIPSVISLISKEERFVLKEYYLEFDEKAGAK